MRVLIVTHNFPPLEGGITSHVLMVARTMSDCRDAVTVLASGGGAGGTDDAEPFRVVRMPARRSRWPRFATILRHTWRLARQWKPDAIYASHWRNCGVAGLFVSWLTGVPLFVAIHGSEVVFRSRWSLWSLLFRLVMMGARGLVALGAYQERLLVRQGFAPRRIFVSPEAVDLERFEAVTEAVVSSFRRELGLDGRRVMLTVGRLIERKGHDVVIGALARVHPVVPNAVYVIVGRGPMEEPLRSLAREKAVESSVFFQGFVPDQALPLYYQACDVFVMPNREVQGDLEGFGIVFVEAGVCGKPVIAGNSGGVGEIVQHGVTGYVVPPQDEAAVADAITDLLLDPARAARMGGAARQRTCEKYGYPAVGPRLRNYLAVSIAHPPVAILPVNVREGAPE